MLSARLSTVALVGFLLISACQSDDETEAPATTPTITVSQGASVSALPTPRLSPSRSGAAGSPDAAFDSFREFASLIQDAVRSQDTNFFIDNAVIGSLECPNELQGDCGYPYPTTIEGIRVGLWQSEGTVQALDEFKVTLGDYLASDPQLYSLAQAYSDGVGVGGRQEYFAILTNGAAPPHTVVFVFVNDGGVWRFSLFMNARTPESVVNDWLSGTCAECYDYWEPWEGS
jgi:hypothetical protein